MKKPIKLVTDLDNAKREAKETIEAALEEHFEMILLVGIKDGQIYTTHSDALNIQKVIGMLELLKMDLWKKWYDG